MAPTALRLASPRLAAAARQSRSLRGGERERLFDGGTARRLSAGSPFLSSSLPLGGGCLPARRGREVRYLQARRQPYLCAPLPMAAHLPGRAAQSAGGSSLCPAPLVKESGAAREKVTCARPARPLSAPRRARPCLASPRRSPSPAAPHMRGGGGSTCPTSAAGCGAGRGGEGKQNYQ